MRKTLALLTAIAAICAANSANAQLLRGRPLRPQGPEVEAFAGEPYGVGRWTVALPQGTNPAPLGNSGFTLTEKNGRAIYQAFQAEPLRTVAREFLGRPQTATVYFLFTGDGPLELQLFAPVATSTTITPQRDAVGHERLLSDWWVKYTRQTNLITRPADYPPLVDNYLLATLSRRLDLPPASQIPPPPIRLLADNLLGAATGGAPKLPSAQTGDAQFDHQLGLLLGSDALRSEMQTQVLQRRAEAPEPADQPLPTGVQFSANIPETLGEVSIEPLAGHVPSDCFYVRFGSFSNYQWFRDTMDRWSGDLQNLINRRGLNYSMTARVERQLSLKESALAPLLGPAVIADVAILGSDLFFREGASMGCLFQARNNFAVSSDFNQQRAATLQREPGCTDQQVDIAGHEVSFLSTPDNRVRSFYATDGDFHFVTNSRHLVEQFFAAADGKNSLGATPEFRLARSLMPANRDYTVFVYLSSQFFQNLAGPHDQIEMDRRLRSVAEIDMALVAQLAAQADAVKATSLDELIKGQYLPVGFGQRSDGSRLEMTASGEFIDTLRGARGSFAPAADVAFDLVTATEARRYQDFAAWLQSKWPNIDPILVGIRREPSQFNDPNVERVILDAQITPLAAKNYDTIANALGPISKQRLAAIPGDVVSAEASLSGNLMASRGTSQPQAPYRLFGALRDAAPEGLNAQTAQAANAPGGQPLGRLPIQIGGGQLNGQLGGIISNAIANAQNGGGLMSALSPLSLLPPFYFGASPTPALFARIGLTEVPLDAAGFGRSPTGLWVQHVADLTLASMLRDVLQTVFPQINMVDAARPAQAWFHCGDLSRSNLANTVNGIFYLSAKNAAIGNVRFLQSLATQLRLPPEDCLKAAEQLTDAKLTCPVGGKYQLEERQGTLPTWISTALPADKMRLISGLFEPAPADYTAPILNWLRGLDADLALDQRILSLHVEIEMQQNGVPGTPNTNGSAAPKLPAAQPGSLFPGLPSLTAPKTPPQQQPPPKKQSEELPPPLPQPTPTR